MTVTLNYIRSKIPENCLVNGKLNKEGCKVVMTGVSTSRLVVDFDKPDSPLSANELRCDYLLVVKGKNARSWLVVLELKKGQLHADRGARQLQAGACAAMKLIPQDGIFRFRPIVATGSVSKHERRRLQKLGLIQFHSQRSPIRWMRCGSPLIDVLIDDCTQEAS